MIDESPINMVQTHRFVHHRCRIPKILMVDRIPAQSHVTLAGSNFYLSHIPV